VDGGDAILPAMTFRAYSSDGSGAWTWYDNLSETVDIYGQWANMQTATKRFEVIAGPQGGVNINGAIKINGVFGITTNYTLSTGDVMSISNGIIVKIAPPTPYAWEPETTNYLARIAVPLNSGAAATNIDVFVKSIKSSGVFSNLDALYPFCGSNATYNAQNLISNNFTITWTGTFGTNNWTGVHNNGANAYGDSGWSPASTNTGTLFAYIAANNPNFAGHRGIMGTFTNTDSIGSTYLRFTTISNSAYASFNDTRYDPKWIIFTSYPAEMTTPWSLSISRTNSTSVVAYLNGVYRDSSTVMTAAPQTLGTAWIFDVNNGGGSLGAWNGKLQMTAMSNRALTPAQHLALYNAIAALNSALGR